MYLRLRENLGDLCGETTYDFTRWTFAMQPMWENRQGLYLVCVQILRKRRISTCAATTIVSTIMLLSTATLSSLLLCLSVTQAAWDASRYLWYTTPAKDLAGTLPIGNGRVAAAIYGSATEKVTLNENSVWSGPWQDRANRNSLKALPNVRSLLQQGKITEAGQMVLDNMAGNPISPRAYNPLVDMGLDFGHANAKLDGFNRVLDTKTGMASVTYMVGGVNYT
jgi:hypothetical protein